MQILGRFYSMERITPVSEQELAHINVMLKDVHIAVSMSMAYIRKFQGWTFVQLDNRFDGVSNSTWKRYLQPSYNKMRPLHVVAAYSWLTMLPMSCFYRGLNVKEAYPDMDDISVECLIHSGLLPKNQFAIIIAHLYDFLTKEQKKDVALSEQQMKVSYGLLEDYEDDDFMFPKAIDINEFGQDYYYSLAISFKEFRKKNKISMETMAHVLSLSTHRYKQCENPDNPVPLPVELGARLQVGFRLQNALPFTVYMKKYPQFHTVRRVQEIRQTLLVAMLKHLDQQNKKRFSAIVSNLSSMYLHKS